MDRQARREEFSTFATEHRLRLLRTARLLSGGDEHRAEDLVQITMTQLFVSWHRVRRADSQLAYALTTMTRKGIDESRRGFRRRELTADPQEWTVNEHQPATPVDDIAPAAELSHIMLAALAELPPRQRAAVVLRHWHDLDVATTAQILDCSPGTVKSQTARGLDHLRSFLDRELITTGERS